MRSRLSSGADLPLKTSAFTTSIRSNKPLDVVNMCEIKYYGGDFTVDRDYYKHLLARQELLSKEISPKVSLRSTLITTFGLTHNEYSGIFSNVITMDDLFA